MDVSQLLEGLNVGVLLLVLCGLCVAGVVLSFILPLIGTVFGVFFSVFDIFGEVLAGGPASWCGCLVVLLGCGVCSLVVAILASVLSTCGTPEAVNFCALFGQ